MSLNNAGETLGVKPQDFLPLAIIMVKYQYVSNDIYREYCDALGVDIYSVEQLTDIPFLPISFFKTHKVMAIPGSERAKPPQPQLTFESSGTTGEQTSRHYVKEAAVYTESLLQGFIHFYGAPQQYAILALLPSYLERQNASLVHMAKVLMEHSKHADNGFYINEWDKLQETILRLEAQGQKILLLGVTFALLDFADKHPMKLEHTIVMETGGMKGRREEMTRKEVHDIFKQQWQLSEVHSEYGMTELLSQAYAVKDGLFKTPTTMKMLVRDINDPLDVQTSGTGALNVIDMSNIHSCPFIATEDIGHVYKDGSFEVLGRMDNSILRGCSLMAV